MTRSISEKKSIIRFYLTAAMANFWYLLNNLVWKFGKSLYQTTSTIFFQILEALNDQVL